MYGLNREASAVRDGRWAVQRLEDVGDDFLHDGLNIRTSDILQAPCYPISADAVILPIWQSDIMDEPAFDREKVAEAMRAQKVTQTGMARVMGLPSQSAFSNIMKHKRRIEAEEAKRAYDFLGLQRPATIQFVPIIGVTAAGRWREAVQMPLGKLPIPPGTASADAFALVITGDSMDKLIPDGGHVVVDPRDKELRDGKCYLIQNADSEATVKCYRRTPARFEPMSNNPEHKGWLASDLDFIVLGRVVLAVQAL